MSKRVFILMGAIISISATKAENLWPEKTFVVKGGIRGEDFGFVDYLRQGSLAQAANGDLFIACKGNRDAKVTGSGRSRNALTVWPSMDKGRTWKLLKTPFPGSHTNHYTRDLLADRTDLHIEIRFLRRAGEHSNRTERSSIHAEGLVPDGPLGRHVPVALVAVTADARQHGKMV